MPESVECTGLALLFMLLCIQKIIYPETFQSQPILLLKIKEILQFRAKAPNFAKFFGKVDTYGLFHYNRYDCKNVKKMENSRAAVWKCGGRQNKNSAAGDELPENAAE